MLPAKVQNDNPRTRYANGNRFFGFGVSAFVTRTESFGNVCMYSTFWPSLPGRVCYKTEYVIRLFAGKNISLLTDLAFFKR